MLNVPNSSGGGSKSHHHHHHKQQQRLLAESRTMANVGSAAAGTEGASGRRMSGGGSLSMNALDAVASGGAARDHQHLRSHFTEQSPLINSMRLSASYESRSKTPNEQHHYQNSDQHQQQILFAPIIDVKIQFILIGDKSVGKSCFLQRYADDMFSQQTTSTVGIDFKQKVVTFPGHKIRLHIWDTAGQERFNSITTAYYRNARGVILLYDVTNRRSFENLVKWLELVRKYARDDAILAIVGNKTDVEGPKVETEEAKQFAEKNAQLFYEASAKESCNVDHVFNDLVTQVLKKMPKLRDPSPSRLKRKRMVVLRPLAEEKNKDWCCVTN